MGLRITTGEPINQAFTISNFFRHFIVGRSEGSNYGRLYSPRYIPRTVEARGVKRGVYNKRSGSRVTRGKGCGKLHTFSGTFRNAKDNGKCDEGGGTNTGSLRYSKTDNGNFQNDYRGSRGLSKYRRTSGNSGRRSRATKFRNRPRSFFRALRLANARIVASRQTRSLSSSINQRVRRNLRFMVGTGSRRVTIQMDNRRKIRGESRGQ